MEKMLFSSKHPLVSVQKLPNGKTDVLVLENERLEDVISETDGDTLSQQYVYDGNAFRTVYEITEDEVKENKEVYLNYDASSEPTLEQLNHDRELIDNYTLQMMEEGLL